MKKFMLLILLVLIFSCSNREMKTAEISISASQEEISQNFENELITKQKLQEYYDLLILKQRHNNFDVSEQLQKIATIVKVVDTNSVRIENLNLIKMQIVSDTIKKTKISYDVIFNNRIRRDTITTIIYSKKISIDNQEFISNKIQFEE